MSDDAEAARLWLGHTKRRLNLDYLPPPEPKRKKPKKRASKYPLMKRHTKTPRQEEPKRMKPKSGYENPGNLLYYQRRKPVEFTVDMIPRVQQLCQWGLTDDQIAIALGITGETLAEWCAGIPEFAEVFVIGDEYASNRVERALYQRAVGYTYQAEKIMVVDKRIERVPYTEYVIPDITAQKIWLTNKRRHVWRDIQQVEHGRVGEFDGMTPAELRAFIMQEAAQIEDGRGHSPDDPGAAEEAGESISAPAPAGGEREPGSEPE